MVLLKLETGFVSTVSSAKGTNMILVLVIISLPIFLGMWRDFFFCNWGSEGWHNKGEEEHY